MCLCVCAFAKPRDQVSISPTFYEQLLRQNPFAKKLRTQNSKHLKAVQRTLVWLSISPIFYKQLFHSKVLCAPFMCWEFGFVIFWQKDFGTKAAHKMLVKLTPGWPEDKRKNLPNFSKIAQKVAKSKKGQNIYNNAQFESQKHLRQTTFETVKYLQQTMPWTCLLRWKFNKFTMNNYDNRKWWLCYKCIISLTYCLTLRCLLWP